MIFFNTLTFFGFFICIMMIYASAKIINRKNSEERNFSFISLKNKKTLSKLFLNSIELYNERIFNINNEYNKMKKCKGDKKAIIVLLYYHEIKKFIDTNAAFLNKQTYDRLIFFATENITSMEMYRNIKYEVIDVSQILSNFPYKFNESNYTPNFIQRGKWNYQHMCRFFFRDIFLHPSLCNVEYYMRLDSESIIKTDLDLFKYMDGNFIYMHNKIMNDDAYVVVGLKEFIISLVEAMNIDILDKENYNNAFKETVLIYYNNFEISKMSFFRSKEMFEFIYLVDLSYGQFIYRWGDAPLRYIALSLYAEHTRKISLPKSVYYCHRAC